MKAPWDPVTLTALWWDGQAAEAGDGLETKTGRRYLILAVRGNKLDCLVLPRGEPIEGRIFEWTWAARGRGKR